MIDMFDTVMNLVKEWNVTGICLRLALATFVGVIIGLDREYKNKGAGIKTHALVCIGAAMAMIVNEYVFREFPNMNTDITRLGAQVISGIGFLGVGTIMMNGRSEVKGLTTAAGLWAVREWDWPPELDLLKVLFWQLFLFCLYFVYWRLLIKNYIKIPKG